jgi:DNA gyrase subunit A
VTSPGYGFTPLQATSIVELQLHRLTRMSGTDLKAERDRISADLKGIEEYFSDPKKLDQYIIDELERGKKLYGRKRRTSLENIKRDMEGTIQDTNHTIFITKKGYVKKISLDINVQGKGGKGRSCGKLKEDDYIISANNVNNKDNILYFTNTGRVFNLKVYEIKEHGLSTLGEPTGSYLPLKEGERVISVLNLSGDSRGEGDNLVFVTSQGLIKKSALKSYQNIQKTGIIALKLNDGDSLTGVMVNTSDDQEVIIATKGGVGVRYKVEEIPLTLRMTYGVKSMTLESGDEIVSANLVADERYLFIMCEDGIGKKIEVESLPLQGRTSKGKLIVKLRGNSVSHTVLVNSTEDLTIITKEKMMKIGMDKVDTLIRSSYGEKLIDMTKKDRVQDIILD